MKLKKKKKERIMERKKKENFDNCYGRRGNKKSSVKNSVGGNRNSRAVEKCFVFVVVTKKKMAKPK